MDNALREDLVYILGDITMGLNPCFNGKYPQSHFYW